MDLLAVFLEKYLERRGARSELIDKGLSGPLIDRYRSGERSPDLEILDRLASAVGIPAWKLIKPNEPLLSPVKREIIRLLGLSTVEDEKLTFFLEWLRDKSGTSSHPIKKDENVG